MAKTLPLYILFFLGIVILLVSIVFRIQHWPGVINIFRAGITCSALFFLVVFWEILSSGKAGVTTKILWLIIYSPVVLCSFFILPKWGALVFIVLGGIYLLFGRRRFLSRNRKAAPIEFDSL